MNEQWAAFDQAWSAAISLPTGWRLRSLERNGTEVEYTGGRKEYVEWWEARARGPEDQEITEVGTWPVQALFELTKTLIELAGSAVGTAVGPTRRASKP